VAESDFAKQASIAAANVAKGAQTGAKSAADGFNRFVEGDNTSARTRNAPIDESKKDFWDSFGDAGRAGGRGGGSAAIGTSAMKKSGGAGGAGKEKKKDDDGWSKW
jgi:ADP-ribosylation factor GTPase-activating protein 1